MEFSNLNILEKDTKRLEELRHLVLHTDTPFTDIIKKYFRITDKKITTHNIVYSNDKGKEVSNYVRRNILNKKEEYEIGEYLISKTAKKLRNSSKAMFRNYRYVIFKKDEKGLAIVEHNNYTKKTKEDIIYFGFDFIKEHFIYDYAKTGHCYQGSTISEQYAILEWKKPMVSRRWFWNAITRASDFHNVYFQLDKKDIEDVKQEEQL